MNVLNRIGSGAVIIMVIAAAFFWDSIKNAGGGSLADWWEWGIENALLLMIGVPVLLFGVGLKQRWNQHSWAGDAMYYLLGGGALITGVLAAVVGQERTGKILSEIRGGAHRAADCWLGDLTGPACVLPDASEIIKPAMFVLLIILTIGAFIKSPKAQNLWGGLATAFMIPIVLFYAWGAAPEEFREAVEERLGMAVDTVVETAEVVADPSGWDMIYIGEGRPYGAGTLTGYDPMAPRAGVRADPATVSDGCDGRYADLARCVTVAMPAGSFYQHNPELSDGCLRRNPAYPRTQLNVTRTGSARDYTNRTGGMLQFKLYELEPGETGPDGRVCPS